MDINVKPPIGLKDRKIHDRQRAFEILKAMYRYVNVGKAIPGEWFSELKYLYGEV